MNEICSSWGENEGVFACYGRWSDAVLGTQTDRLALWPYTFRLSPGFLGRDQQIKFRGSRCSSMDRCWPVTEVEGVLDEHSLLRTWSSTSAERSDIWVISTVRRFMCSLSGQAQFTLKVFTPLDPDPHYDRHVLATLDSRLSSSESVQFQMRANTKGLTSGWICDSHRWTITARGAE